MLLSTLLNSLRLPLDGCCLANSFILPFLRASSRLKYLPVAILCLSSICFANTEYHHEVWHNQEYTDLYNPAPTPTVTSQDKQEHTADTNSESETIKENASHAIAPIKVDAAITTENDAENYAADSNKNTSAENGINWISFFIVISGISTAIIAFFTYKLYSVTTKSANHAADSVEIMRKNAVIQMRAYLSAIGGRLYYIQGHTLRAEVIIRNSGSTIAHDMQWTMCGELREPIEDSNVADFPPPELRPWKMPLAPNSDWTIGHEFTTPKLTQQDIDDVYADRKWVYVWGYVKYRDIYGVWHTMSFRYRNIEKRLRRVGDQQAIESWGWFPMPEGNETD